jgi:hypothetical protein
MSNIGDFLGGIGLFLCVGAIVVIGLLALAIRAFSRPKTTQAPLDPRGPEAPRYNDPEIDTRGGFGGVPTTGSVQDYEADYDRNRTGTTTGTVGSSGFGGEQNPPPDRSRADADEEDDDQVSSSGGFGRG